MMHKQKTNFQSLVSRDLAILVVAGLTIFMIATPIWMGRNYDILSRYAISDTMVSETVYISSVAFLVSTVPAMADVLLDTVTIFRGSSVRCCFIGRFIICLSCFLASLQLTVIKDNSSILGFTQYSEYSFLFTIFSLRIVVLSALLYNLTVSNSKIFKFELTFFLTVISSVFTIVRCYAIGQKPLTQIAGIISFCVSITYGITILYWIRQLIIKCWEKLSLENYACILYLMMLSIVSTASLGPVLENYTDTGYLQLVDIPSCHPKPLSYVIYAFTFLSFVMMIVPGRLARYEAYLNMAHIVRTKTEYVRYISHEMRTPLNTVFLGLNLALSQLPEHSERKEDTERKETLQEISSACKAALDILNELLLYDKLESGMLVLSKTDVKVPSLIYDAVSMFGVQLREKQLDLMVTNNNDVMISSEKNMTIHKLSSRPLSGGTSSIYSESAETIDPVLHKSRQSESSSIDSNSIHSKSTHLNSIQGCTPILYDDMIHIDQYKIIQVIRNIISNAIKFTPMNGKIHVNMKFEPMEVQAASTLNGTSTLYERMVKYMQPLWMCMTFKRDTSAADDDKKTPSDIEQLEESSVTRNLQKKVSGLSCLSTTSTTNKAIHGHLVIEITDTGAGISEENQKKLFHEIIQFQPEVLQHGGGSGLGMCISKSIMDLHQGYILVSSPGEGCGATFTLKLPITRTNITRSKLNEIKVPSPLYMNTMVDSESNPSALIKPLTELGTPPDILSSRHFIPIPKIHLSSKVLNVEDLSSKHISIKTDRTDITLPVLADVDINFNTPRLNTIVSQQVFKTMKSMKFLVVDDSRLNRKMLCRLLKSLGHTCDEANDGVEAVSMIKTAKDAYISTTTTNNNNNNATTTNNTHHENKDISEYNGNNGNDSGTDKLMSTITPSPIDYMYQDTYQTMDYNTSTTATANKTKPEYIPTPESSFLSSMGLTKKTKAFIALHSTYKSTNNCNKRMELQSSSSSIEEEKKSSDEWNPDNNEHYNNQNNHSHIYINRPIYTTESTSLRHNIEMNTNTTSTTSVNNLCTYDAITMDFMMPHMDGPTATAEIRKLGYTGPIIGVTGNALPSDIDYFKEKGATSVLVKPIEIDALQAVLRSHYNNTEDSDINI